MADNQNFEKDINVPSKEQIMIDGVNVNRCIDFNKRDKVSCYHILYDKCNESPNCYFKQLARKTQECEQIKEKYEALKLENQEGYEIVAELEHEREELKERLERVEEDLKHQCVDCMNIKSDRYRKALEEIEGLVKNFCKDCDDYEDCNWEKEGCYYSLIPNLKDIINKAKGEEDKQ